MRIPHFFKAKTRLGIVTLPHGETQLNIGVEDGADAILTTSFLTQFPEAALDSCIFSLPESLDAGLVNQAIAHESMTLMQCISAKVKPSETQVVIGGDHSITFPSFLAVLDRIDDVSKVGYIQFDSHGDINLAKDSPTKNFHGMYVRPFIDAQFDIPEIMNLVKKRISPEQIFFIGNLDLDVGEKLFFQKHHIKSISKKDITTNPVETYQKIVDFTEQFTHLHITIDIDVFDKSIAPATGIPAENGFLQEEVLPILSILSNHPSISIDISEINPRKEGGEKTVKLAQELLLLLLK